ncbi:PadR family transcriptional regulator [Paenarthrobacter sp. PH39-S1]|uniref:PadR family transcriptional regulator n=1 Tax=Micrococcaceae TaxID=1268 RepID=UPI0024BB3705|nr:PadR family transcriptional regulator [Paenarthrobacter sp. PH39-S1]MDJ0355921.1 PadR family transcriptional regulator [Paenarthrobacter sp. PH39-S1]
MPRSSALNPLSVAALALLAERPMHPYEMYQLLMARSEDRLLKIRPGTLYHCVGRLEEQGLVRAAGTDREGNRPERTSYEISGPGREALSVRLRDLLATPVNEYPSFPLGVAEAHNLPGDDVVELLEERVAALEGQLTRLVHGERIVTEKNVAKKYWIDLSYQMTMLRAEIDWVRGLQKDIKTGSLGW